MLKNLVIGNSVVFQYPSDGCNVVRGGVIEKFSKDGSAITLKDNRARDGQYRSFRLEKMSDVRVEEYGPQLA